MKMKIIFLSAILSMILAVSNAPAFSQACSTLVVSSVPFESRCMSTGYITVTAGGGSGSYNYKASGPVSTSYTSSNTITGLPAGNYTVTVKDIVTSCVKDVFNVIVPGTYEDPRFSLIKTDETCLNSSNGSVTVTGQTGGRAPFSYTIVAPSPFGVGTTNATGVFTGLIGGEYAIQLRDSCGGIQTRRVTVNAYDWWIDNLTGNRNNCTNADFSFTLRDNRGNTNTSGTVFSAFTYGVVNSVGDTTWFATRNFTFDIQTRRSLTLVAKDGCGNVKSTNWNVNPVPGVAGAASTSQQSCNSFSASITGQSGLTSPQYTLFTSANVFVSSNATGNFSGFPAGSYYINIRDNCFDTTIRRNFTVSQPVPFLSPTITTTRTGCKTFNATATGLTNFTSPTFRLYNASNTLIATQASATFNNLTNGYYCITIEDACTGTILTRCFTVADLVPSLNANVTIFGSGCTTANVSIGGQTNLNNPQFCLYDASNVLVACNATGTFNNVPYGNYCLRMTNDAACYDTTIQRCFTIDKSIPTVSASMTVTRSCNTVNLSIGGQANLTNAQYCLYDASNVLIACNATGVFNNMPYGTYCMDIQNDASCYDTVIRRCVTVTKNIPSIGAVNLSSTFCSGFTATVSSQTNLSSPVFELKNSVGVVVASNNTGVFTNLAYGSYSVEMQNSAACYDTLIIRNFSATRPAPDAGSVIVNGQTCTTFNANFNGEINITAPVYYLLNNVGDTIANNGTGTFNNIAFGDYSIRMYDACYDTTIIRSFTGSSIPVAVNVTAQASCIVNATDIRIQFTTGFAPYTVNVYDPFNVLVGTVTTSSNPAWVTGLPALAPTLQYRVVALDNCGNSATRFITPVISTFNKSASIEAKCPSGLYQNGSSNIVTTVTSTLGTVYPLIIKKNLTAVSLGYTTQSGNTFTWVDLEPATYVIQYDLPGSCTNMIYDTLVVAPYDFPTLNNSAAYQCDNNDFSVGASVSGGSAPYTYQVIGSVPAAPSINTVPQASPVFTVTNGQIYSLIRLRAVDNCGNATLNDVSILPLANVVVNSSSACFYNSVTLTVDSVSNATYTWYKKTSPSDSVEVGNLQSFSIPFLLPTDTGTYVAKVTVNSGCLTKLTYYTLTTACGIILPAKEVTLSGKQSANAAELSWVAKEEKGVKEYILERSSTKDGQYTAIGNVPAKNNTAASNYYIFKDSRPDAGVNYYRLRIADENGKSAYSNIVLLKWTSKGISIYPNPARDHVNIEVNSSINQDMKFSLYNVSGQLMQEKTAKNFQHQVIQFERQQLKAGMYLLKMTDMKTGELTTEKILFQ